MIHPLLLVSERVVSRDKGMHPAEVLFSLCTSNWKRVIAVSVDESEEEENLFYW
jgi:hypothetical protein